MTLPPQHPGMTPTFAASPAKTGRVIGMSRSVDHDLVGLLGGSDHAEQSGFSNQSGIGRTAQIGVRVGRTLTEPPSVRLS